MSSSADGKRRIEFGTILAPLLGLILLLTLGMVLLWLFSCGKEEVIRPETQIKQVLQTEDTAPIEPLLMSVVWWDGAEKGFVREIRPLPVVSETEVVYRHSRIESAIENLFSRPGLFPEGTLLRNMYFAGGTVYVDVNEAIRSRPAVLTGEWAMLESIGRTIVANTEENEIPPREMLILVEGKEVSSLGGRLSARLSLEYEKAL